MTGVFVWIIIDLSGSKFKNFVGRPYLVNVISNSDRFKTQREKRTEIKVVNNTFFTYNPPLFLSYSNKENRFIITKMTNSINQNSSNPWWLLWNRCDQLQDTLGLLEMELNNLNVDHDLFIDETVQELSRINSEIEPLFLSTQVQEVNS